MSRTGDTRLRRAKRHRVIYGQWADPNHADCVVCAYYVTVRARQAARMAAEIHAASLRASARPEGHSGPDKAEDPGAGTHEVFTDPRQVMADGMVADDQCDSRAR